MYILITWMLATGAADVSNERIQVSGHELEQHWHVDCRGMIDYYNQSIVPGNPEIATDALRNLADVAEKCSFIYNRENTGRTVTCPEYLRIRNSLLNLISHNGATESSDLVVEKCDE